MSAPTDLPDPYSLVAKALDRPRETVTLDSGMYRDHGWDSFGHVSVILALQEAYGILIEDADVAKYTSMRAIIELYERLRGGGSAH